MRYDQPTVSATAVKSRDPPNFNCTVKKMFTQETILFCQAKCFGRETIRQKKSF